LCHVLSGHWGKRPETATKALSSTDSMQHLWQPESFAFWLISRVGEGVFGPLFERAI